jgi:hypothetical protein
MKAERIVANEPSQKRISLAESTGIRGLKCKKEITAQ